MAGTQGQINDNNQLANANRADKRMPRPLLILAVFAMLLSATSLMVSRDMLVRYQTQLSLQIAADRAAMAGAVYLPGWPARALRAAEQSTELSGLRRSNMVYAQVAPDGTSLRLALKFAAPVVILRLFHSGADVVALSTMGACRVQRPAAPNRFSPAVEHPT